MALLVPGNFTDTDVAVWRVMVSPKVWSRYSQSSSRSLITPFLTACASSLRNNSDFWVWLAWAALRQKLSTPTRKGFSVTLAQPCSWFIRSVKRDMISIVF